MTKMRAIEKGTIEKSVLSLCEKASCSLDESVKDFYREYLLRSGDFRGSEVIGLILENSAAAENENRPVCQDTGIVCVFASVGSNLDISKIDLALEINSGVKKAGEKGVIRNSMVSDVFPDENSSRSASPASVYFETNPGDKLELTLMLRGGGAENSGRSGIFLPNASKEEIYRFVEKTTIENSINSCPPVIIGIGMGGTCDRASFLSLKALTRDIGQRSVNEKIAEIETAWLSRINSLGIGPAGFGGSLTAVELFIETFPRHISSFPVSVSFQCCAARKAKTTI
ncbi:fumarate hydratase [candidate division WOR-3 bacterium]|nr:fumarate hydratase [candidate division WOR-3 bacterium]